MAQMMDWPAHLKEQKIERQVISGLFLCGSNLFPTCYNHYKAGHYCNAAGSIQLPAIASLYLLADFYRSYIQHFFFFSSPDTLEYKHSYPKQDQDNANDFHDFYFIVDLTKTEPVRPMLYGVCFSNESV